MQYLRLYYIFLLFRVLNYAAIGSILGHELTHGFDNTGQCTGLIFIVYFFTFSNLSGRKYDVHGSYNQWWSNKTVEAFEDLTKCFVKQYSNYTVPSVDGKVITIKI